MSLPPEAQGALGGSLVPFMLRAPKEAQIPGLGLGTMALGGKGGG